MSLCDPTCTGADAEPTTALLATVVERFYGKARLDPQLGEVFEGAVDDWPGHLARITKFWSATMSGDGTYRGQPLRAHAAHAAAMTPARFERWLALWAETTTEVCPPELAEALQATAARIAESMQHALAPARARAGWVRLPIVGAAPPVPVPYKSTPVFDETSLPKALRRAHQTKAGVWGVIRVLEGRLRLHVDGDPVVRELDAAHPAMVEPEQRHHVEPVGAMRMQVDFYDTPPSI